MRAVTKAAALLLLQSVVGESMPPSVRRVSATETIPTVYIKIKVPAEKTGSEIIPLRFDLSEGDDACSPANLTVNGQQLTQDADGFGEGILTLADDLKVASNWTFACASLKQVLTFNVNSVNGRAFPGVSFTTNFYQTTPVQIASVENVASVQYKHIHTSVSESLTNQGEEHIGIEYSFDIEMDHVDDIAEDGVVDIKDNYDDDIIFRVDEPGHKMDYAPAEVNAKQSIDHDIATLKDLRAQARELAAMIREQEDALSRKMMHSASEKIAVDVEDQPTPLEECRDVRCAFKALAFQVRTGHAAFCEGTNSWKALFGCTTDDEFYIAEEMEMLGDDDEDGDDYALKPIEWEFDLDDDDYVLGPDEWEIDEFDYEEAVEAMRREYHENARIRMLIVVAESAFIFGAAVFCLTSFARYLFNCRRRRRSCRHHRQSSLPVYQDSHYFDEPKTLITLGYVDEKAVLVASEELAQVEQKCSVSDEFSQFRLAASVVSDLVAVDAAERRSSVDYDDKAPPAYERGAERDHSL